MGCARLFPSYELVKRQKYPLLQLVCDGFRVHDNEHKRLALELYKLLNYDPALEEQLKAAVAYALRDEVNEVENVSVKDALWRSRRIAR